MAEASSRARSNALSSISWNLECPLDSPTSSVWRPFLSVLISTPVKVATWYRPLSGIEYEKNSRTRPSKAARTFESLTSISIGHLLLDWDRLPVYGCCVKLYRKDHY